jgi:hypothetical protein
MDDTHRSDDEVANFEIMSKSCGFLMVPIIETFDGSCVMTSLG